MGLVAASSRGLADFRLAVPERLEPHGFRRHPGHIAVHEPRASPGQRRSCRPANRRLLRAQPVRASITLEPTSTAQIWKPVRKIAGRTAGHALVCRPSARPGNHRAQSDDPKNKPAATRPRSSWLLIWSGSWMINRSAPRRPGQLERLNQLARSTCSTCAFGCAACF